MILSPLIGLFPLTWPEPLRKAAAWATVAVTVAAVLWGAKAAYDASVIGDHEERRTIRSIEARDASAEERAHDAIEGILADQQRQIAIAKAEAEEAAKPVEERAALPPTTKALNCKRMEQAFTQAELAKMTAYQRECS